MILLSGYYDEIWDRDKETLLDLMHNTTFDETQKLKYGVMVYLCETEVEFNELRDLFIRNAIERKDRVEMRPITHMEDITKAIARFRT